MKTLGSDRIQKSPKLPSPSEVKVPNKESTNVSHSNETKWQNNDGKTIASLQIFHQNDLRGTGKREKFASLTTQHHRNRREIDSILESKVGPTKCANFTFTIKYKDDYSVWNNFSIMYQSRMYYYKEYRVTDYGPQVCNSSDPLIQQKWHNFIAREKKMTIFTHCNVSVDGFYFEHYTLLKNFTVLFHPTEQNFTRRDYGVIFGHFAICSAKLSLSCNDDLVKVKYGEQYNVFKNFSLFTTIRCTIIVNIDTETKVLKCVLPMIQEFRLFGELGIRGKSLKISINVADLLKKYMHGITL